MKGRIKEMINVARACNPNTPVKKSIVKPIKKPNRTTTH
jgi:hypothetical protein